MFVVLQEYGFTREQSSNALIIHGTVEKALEVLSALNRPPGECHEEEKLLLPTLTSCVLNVEACNYVIV